MTYLAQSFVALADPTRRGVFESLARRPQSVRELAAGMPVSRPAVSQHLKILQSAGLVFHWSKGTSNIYQIDSRGIEAMRNYLDQFWNKALVEFKKVAEEEKRK